MTNNKNMCVFVVEAGGYEEKHIVGIYRTEDSAKDKKEEWDKANAYEGSIILERHGGDGVKRYMLNDASITMWEVDD